MRRSPTWSRGWSPSGRSFPASRTPTERRALDETGRIDGRHADGTSDLAAQLSRSPGDRPECDRGGVADPSADRLPRRGAALAQGTGVDLARSTDQLPGWRDAAGEIRQS